MILVSAIFLSLAAASIVALPACFTELKKHPEDMPLLLDVKTFWGRKLSPREVFWCGLFIHFLMAAAFGLLYESLIIFNLVKPFHLDNLLAYATAFFLVVGGVVFPLVRCGFFGSKMGPWVWFELLVVHHLFGFFMWLLVRLFPLLTP